MTENLRETTVKKMKKGHFRLTCVAQKRCCLSSLLFKGDADVNTRMAEAKRNVSAGIKQLKIAKWKVELKEKKNENVKLKEEGVPGAIYLEKNQKNAQ